MMEFLYYSYLVVGTLIFVVEFTNDTNFFKVLIGFLLGGALLIIVPVLPIYLLKLIFDNDSAIKDIIGIIYLSLIIFLCFKYFIAGYFKSEVNTKQEESKKLIKKTKKAILEQKHFSTSNHDRFKPNVIPNVETKKVQTTASKPKETKPKLDPIQKQKVKEVLPKQTREIHEIKKPKENKTKLEHVEKLKAVEVLPKPTIETKSSKAKIKFVDYNLNFTESETNFPIIKIPNHKCVIRSHRHGSTKRRGVKEERFKNALTYFFAENFEVTDDIRLNTGKNTRPYEPDIALIGSSDYNIRIDIEIDEPYAGITRQPTHCMGDDTNRDNYFKDRGWIVIRFSEYQVHTQEKQCLKFISEIVNLIDDSIEIPEELIHHENLAKEKVWDIVQAQKWEKAKYREEYLNHEFKRTEEFIETIKRDFNSQEIEEENLVKPTSLGTKEVGKNISFNKTNQHSRDNRIKFYSEKHAYTIDNVPASSVSTIIGRFFPKFDSKYWSNRKAPQLGMTATEVAKMWKEKGNAARDKGTFLHEQIENYYLGIDYKKTEEFHQFENFVKNHQDLKPYRSEWRIFDENFNIAGTIDLIVSNGNEFDIYDWKRSKKVVNSFNGLPIKNNQWQQGIGGLKHIDDTSYNRYCLQQSLYKYVLEKNYNVKIKDMFLIVMYPENDNYYKVNVPYLEKEIEYILQSKS